MKKNKGTGETIISYAYENDLEQMYAFYCARYENIKFDDFMKLGFEEFSMKLASIPESEPLFKIIKSRTIDLTKIKDKEERRYWRELKKINEIPDIYKPLEELDKNIQKEFKNMRGMI